MSRARIAVLLALCACAVDAPEPRPAAAPPEAFAEGLEVRLPGAVLRAGRTSLGAAGLAAIEALVPSAHAEPPPAAIAAPTAAPVEVEVNADRLSLDGGSAGAARLSGHVRLRRGDLSVTCDRLDARADPTGALVEAHATGSVRVQRGALVATAASARLDLARGEVILDGPVRIVRAEGVLEGARVVISLADGAVTVDRVRGTLRMRAATPAAGPPR